MNLLGGVGVAVVMGVGGTEVGVGGSDSDERKQTPVLAEEDQEGSCFAGFGGFSTIAALSNSREQHPGQRDTSHFFERSEQRGGVHL